MSKRKYLPTLSDLIDRLSIVQLKAILIPEKRDAYREEIALIENDIDILLTEKRVLVRDSKGPYRLTARDIRDIMVLMLVNREIWRNESEVRNGTGGGDLRLTHSLNGVRNTAKNHISHRFGDREDFKIDALAAELQNEYVNWRVWDE